MADDELDELYSARPDGFTALRRKLADAAKQRGDPAAAKRISAARKPTTAAWIVNRLALQHKEIQQQLNDLGDKLRDAHAAMDGARIRKLSAQQRHTVDELVRVAFQTAEVKNPSAALREDVTATLQAAIADSDVTAELGRLSKAEQWSGFGFGAAAAEEEAEPTEDAGQRRDELKAQLAEAKQQLAAARRRRDETRRDLRDAERDLDAATKAYDKARRADREAEASVEKAETRLQQLR
jgi:chromosome segregation ATPase